MPITINKPSKIRWFGDSNYIGNWIENSERVLSMDNADIVIMPGGGDWCPKIYNEKTGSKTHYNEYTDIEQLTTLRDAIRGKKAIIGICRGAQLLCIAEGGKLIQHVSGHGYSHEIHSTRDRNRKFTTNSLHHQMLNLTPIPKERWDLLYYAKGISGTYLNGNNEEIIDFTKFKGDIKEPEIVLFNYIRGLAIQGHPEMSMDHRLLEEINRIIVNELLPMAAIPGWTTFDRIVGMLRLLKKQDVIMMSLPATVEPKKHKPFSFTHDPENRGSSTTTTTYVTKSEANWRDLIRESGQNTRS